MNILRKQRILSGKTIKNICDVYGCTVDDVIGIYNAESGAADAP